MDIYLIFVIVVVSVIQSLFGVGVLLFGTPILLFLGYEFADVLTILLPISLSINLIQIIRDHKHISFIYYKKLLTFTIPPIVLCLAFAVEMNINVSFYVGSFLIFISLKSFFLKIKEIVLNIFKYERLFLITMGILHGLTNLGGSLLTSQIFTLDLNKLEKRATISLSYFTFAIFQLLTLVTLGKLQDLKVELIFVGITTYLLVDYFIYANIPDRKYDKVFAIFLLLSGASLVTKSVT